MAVRVLSFALPALTALACAPTPGQDARPGPSSSATFEDPAPPRVRELPPIEAPAAAPFDELTTHRAPRALDPDAVVEDWPGFLGPRRDGRTVETPLDLDWPAEGPPLVFEIALGEGYSSPAIADGRLVIAHRVGDEALVDCVDPKSGQRFWRHASPCNYQGRYIESAGPRATPEIHDGRVFVHGVDGLLTCLELATGRVVWQRHLSRELGIGDQFFGVVASPLAYGDLLIQNVGAPGGPSVAAFEQRSGRIVWGAGERWGPSCASPVPGAPFGDELVYVMTGGESRPPSGGLMVLEPRTGRVLLEHPFRSRTTESVNGASPVVCGERVFLTASYGVGSEVLALAPDVARGGGYESLWSNRRIGFQFQTPIHADGVVWAIDGVPDRGGALIALDVASGAERVRESLEWTATIDADGEPVERTESVGEGSLLAADGHFLCLGDTGLVLVLRADADGVEIVSGMLPFRAGESWTPLVVSHGLLYVRQNQAGTFGSSRPRLLCFDVRG